MDAIPHFDDIAEEQEQWEALQQNISYGKRPSSFFVGGGSSQSVARRMPQKKPKRIGPIDLFFTQDADEYGPGIKSPSYHEVRVTYLKKELEHTRTILRENDETRAKYGWSLMADGWSDRKQRRLINFRVNDPKGTKFIESVDGSSYAHTGAKMFESLDS
ncbi:hypothetical protein Salat_1420300 [Sesamum alatum]|uniref:DUF659 domain-containing protein n=1 Tax=Sesamum alatum TaxID=300844 RepID=A0AAE1YAF5_9LAMI|nr:hypothetical protein Salat_1420300 [Sesamum alatum]